MTARIGEVPIDGWTDPAAHVGASRGGVELHCSAEFTVTPIGARNFAALLVRAADEVERMRASAVAMSAPSQ
jgi:hypothetical protein